MIQDSLKSKVARSKFFTFMLCLLFSFLAWLSIKISRETVSNMPVELQISNLPTNLIITHKSDSILNLSIQTTGIRLLTNRSMKRANILETDFSSLQRARGGNEHLYFFAAAQAEMRYSFINDIPRQQVKFQPDTIFIQAIPAFRKKVPVLVQKEIDFKNGFRIYSFPVISPDSVWVSGPLALNDSIQFISTEPVRGSGIDKDLQVKTGLVNPFTKQNVSISTSQVNVFIPVDEFTEASVELDIDVDCLGIDSIYPGSRISLLPDRVTVSYLVALKDSGTISDDVFRAAVACPDTITSVGTRLQVEIIQHPGFVEIISIRPPEVEFILIRNN